MSRCTSASTAESPMRKNPFVTLATRVTSLLPRSSSDCFITIAGTLAMLPAEKSAGKLNVISIVWVAGRVLSVLRRIDQVIVILRSGISMSARTASSGATPGPAETVSVRQMTEPM